MAAFKAPNFTERAALSREAKQKALDLLKSKPAPDEAVLAERRAARLAREEAEAAKRAAVKAAREAEKEAKKLEAAQRAEAEKAAIKPARTEAELKAARDARYAARKARKG